MTAKKAKKNESTSKQKSRVSQSDVPAYSLEHALRIPVAIHENYEGKPTTPLRVASAMNVQPGSGPFRTLCGAAIAYGLTEGGYNAPEIKLTPLGQRVVRPLKEGDDLAAKREAMLTPRVVKDFLSKYDGSPIPKDSIAENVLNDLGVPSDRTSEVLALILQGAEALHLITDIKGKRYVELQGATPPVVEPEVKDESEGGPAEGTDEAEVSVPTPPVEPQAAKTTKLKRVFITHGKNKEFVEPIKRLLTFGEMEPVVSVEKQSVSQPVPDKVMNDMRSCGAAIIHVEDEMRLMDSNSKEHVVLNPNVLIEIGAAMALYGKRFILLVKDGVKLPSNLQGLFEVRYTGASLDGEATIKLLEAINEMKKVATTE